MSEQTPACLDRWFIYDVLIDRFAGPTFTEALLVAKGLCGSCPLRDKCLVENRHEPWAQAVTGWRPPTLIRATCGTSAGAQVHYKARESACVDCRRAAAAAKAKRVKRARVGTTTETV